MAVSLESFVNHAGTIDGNRSIYLDHKGEVKDKGAFRTFFTRKDTFRKTTNEFLNALSQQFGQEIGGVARELLQKNVEAGKPLTGSVVKSCVSMAHQLAMRKTLNGITGNQGSMESFVKELTGGQVTSLTPQQFNQIKQVIFDHQQSLEKLASGSLGGDRESLVSALQNGEGALLKRSIDLIGGNQNSPLVRLGYPKEGDPQLVKDKLQVLNMLQTMDGPIVNNPVLIQAMTALETLRASNPAPGEFTAADLFNAVYPENTTPTLNRPSNEEIALYTPSQLLNLFDQANGDFTDNFTAEMLPENSPLRGTDSHTSSALSEAKGKLFMPGTIATLSGDRVTLKDLPQMQFDVSVNSKYDTLDSAVTQMAKDISRRGMMGMTSAGLPPTISFQATGGETETVTIGSRKFEGIPDEQLTADQKAYKAGNESSVSRDLLAKVNSLADSPAQAKAMVGCLNQSGSYPMWHAMKGFGDFAYFREHCAYNQSVTQNSDGSVDISLTTSADLKSLVGTASMTYHVDVDGRVGISDFQWDKPTLQERKDGMKTCAGYSQSIPSRINSAIQSLGLIDTAAKIFSAQAHAILDAKVDAATTSGELPSFESIRDAMPPSRDADPGLADFAKIAQHQTALRFYMAQPQENQAAFAAAVIACRAESDDMAMNLIIDCLPQLKELHEAGNLNADTAWQTMFGEEMPADSKQTMQRPDLASSPVSSKLLKQFMEKAQSFDRQQGAFGAFFGGVTYDVAMGLNQGTLELDHITLEHMRTGAGGVANDLSHVEAMENPDGSEKALALDLKRMNGVFDDKLGKLQNDSKEAGSISIELSSGKEGAPEKLQFDPMNPQGLSEEEQAIYKTGKPNAITSDIRERLTAFCGGDNKVQVSNVLIALSQSGRKSLRNMPQLFGMTGSEHCKAKVTVFGDDQKNVHVRYQNLDNSILKFDYELSFSPDGRQQMVAFDMHRADVD